MLYNKEIEETRQYWLDKCPNEFDVNSFSDLYSSNIISEYKNEKIEFNLPSNISEKMITICNGAKYGIYMILASGVEYLLHRYNSSEKVIIAIPKLKSDITASQNNLKLLINEVFEDNTFKQFLLQIKETIIFLNKKGSLNINEIAELVGIDYNEDENGFFDTIVLLENIHNIDDIKNRKITTVFSFNIMDNEIKCTLEYNPNKLSEIRCLQVKSHLINYFTSVVENPNIKLSNIKILSDDEMKLLVSNSIGTSMDYNKNDTLHAYFERQVDKTPNLVAVTYLDKELTYKQLNFKANKLARVLRNSGVGAGSIVCLIAERSLEMIIGILAILKSGGAYLPINPKDPGLRIEYILKDSNANILLTQEGLANNIEFSGNCIIMDQIEINDIDETNLKNINKSADLAYVIYTSGTTGDPKGVMIKHQNVVNLVLGLSEKIFKYHANYINIACVAPYYFDASVQQIFTSLLLGNNLCIVPDSVRADGDALLDFYHNNNIIISDGTPTHISMMLNSSHIDEISLNIEHYIIGGEKLQYSIIKKFMEKFNKKIYITNVYGPTECCVDCTSFLIKKDYLIGKNDIPIGTPMPNQSIYIFDDKLRMVPIGVLGELYITGDGVGLGYLNRLNLNNEKYIKNPYSPKEYLYKTGDIGRWNSDGNIEYICRKDNQVKIRGYRIELGEIENKLLDYEINFASSDKNIEIQRCKNCLVSSEYLDISFNNDSVCNICENYSKNEEKIKMYFREIKDFQEIMKNAKGKNKNQKYDCLLLYSGGKDSSYVLYRLVEMGYKVLAFTFDNGYISERAFTNIKKITESLNVDSIICKAENIKEIFVESLHDDSTVCTGCFKALTAMSTKMAFIEGINVVITGLSRGQILDTKLRGLYDQEIFNIDEIENNLLLFRKIYHSINDRVSELLGIEFKNEKAFDETYFIDFYRYSDESPDKILEYLIQKDEHWSMPEDTGFCSTNCLINNVGIYMHLKNRGYHNYMLPLSWSCRLGQLSRESGLNELEANFDINRINNILSEIGYKEINQINGNVIKEVAVIDTIDEFGDKFLSAYFVSDITVNIFELKKYLLNILPEYAIPSYFTQIDKIPKTSNGKLDRRSLTKLKLEYIRNVEYVEPRTVVEKRLALIWNELLKVEEIGINDNFFELGGHSLKAMLLVAKIQEDFGVNINISNIFKYLTISKISEYIDSCEKNNINVIPVAENKEYYKVSSNQKRMYILNVLYPNSTAYNVINIQVIKGSLSKQRVEDAFINLINRHDILRTSFSIFGDEVIQKVNEKVNFKIRYMEEKENNVNALIDNFIKPFNLSEAPLLKVALIKLDIDKFLFVFDIHHIISDAVTLHLLMNEFSVLYNGAKLPELKLQYKDYAEWQNSLKNSQYMNNQEEYWKNVFNNYKIESYLPLDYPRLNTRITTSGKRVFFNIGKKLTAQLDELSIRTKTTLFMVLFTAYNILISKYSNKEDLVIGTPIAGRQYPELDRLAGVFINTLAIRSYPNECKKISDFLEEVKNNLLEVYENQDYPFDVLVETLGIQRDINRNPLFDTMFVFESVDFTTMKIDGLEFIPYRYDNRASMMDLILVAERKLDRIKFQFEYNDRLFKESTIKNLINNYVEILKIMCNDDKLIKDFLFEFI